MANQHYIMEFIIMTLSFTVAIMLNPKVLGWCMKKVNELTTKMINESFDSDEEL